MVGPVLAGRGLGGGDGARITTMIGPRDDDYFVLKPKHSGFYSTQLDLLLEHLGARTLILTGIQANICVLFTANDAYMRDYTLVVPSDCVASTDPADAEYALEQMRGVLKAQVTASDELDLDALVRPPAEMAARPLL